MPILNLATAQRRAGGSHRLPPRNLLAVVFLAAVLIISAFMFSTLRTSIAPSGDRARIIALFDSGGDGALVDSCSADEVDYMPCEDPRRNRLLSRDMNFYRERQCPSPEEAPLCLVPPPGGYRAPVRWPDSLDKIWHDNMPYDKIAERKGHQGWMKEEGPYFIFPGGGTMFPGGAEGYIAKLEEFIPIRSGLIRTALDMGCGVASFGGYLLKENVMTFSFAPRDSHKSQIQFALERGIPAMVAMLGTRRLPFPATSFDLVHCSRCLIPFTAYNGTYFIEVDRLLRPGGFLVISGPPVKWAKQEKEWEDIQAMTHALCYKLVTVDGNTAIWKKPTDASCLPNQNKFELHLCSGNDDPDEAWYFELKKCVNKLPLSNELAVGTVSKWPDRLSEPPARLKLASKSNHLFETDSQLWAQRVAYYKKSLDIKIGTPHIRNVMDMNANFGSFAAALNSYPVWVMNVVPARKPLTLGVIYDRGLIGVYHDWCEAFSTYPRTYDLIHIGDINSLIKYPASNKRSCHLIDLMVEMDRILRPGGTAIVRDSPEVIGKVANIALAIRWTVKVHESEPDAQGNEKILVATKNFWKLSSN